MIFCLHCWHSGSATTGPFLCTINNDQLSCTGFHLSNTTKVKEWLYSIWLRALLLSHNLQNVTWVLGTGDDTKTDKFSEKFQGEGGRRPFQSKTLFCKFCTLKQGFLSMIWKKNAIRFSENEGEGVVIYNGRLELFWKFTRFGIVTCPGP